MEKKKKKNKYIIEIVFFFFCFWKRGTRPARGGGGGGGGPEGPRRLRFPDFVTTAQDGGRLSALRTGHFKPRKYSRYSFLLRAESTPGP